MDKKQNSGMLNGKRAFILALVSAIVGGAGGPLLLVKLNGPSVFRPDAFTGSQGAALEKQLEYHIKNHPDALHNFDRRITKLETQNEIIIKNQFRILDRIERSDFSPK